MELNGENIFTRILKAFICPVIDIDESRRRHFWIQLVHIHYIAMVLGRDIYPPCSQILYRVFPPLCPYFILKVSAPVASAMS